MPRALNVIEDVDVTHVPHTNESFNHEHEYDKRNSKVSVGSRDDSGHGRHGSDQTRGAYAGSGQRQCETEVETQADCDQL